MTYVSPDIILKLMLFSKLVPLASKYITISRKLTEGIF